MPELPEVETVKIQLNQVLPNLIIKALEVRTPKVFHGNSQELIGKRIEKVERKGKMIVVKLITDNGEPKTILLIHLKLTGRLIFDKAEYEKEKHTHIIITFTNGKKLYFWDLRKFGWIKTVSNPPAGWVGIDPLVKKFTVELFQNLLGKSKKPVKIFLMEQDKIAGIGNIYANESLFCARIDPRKKASLLSKEKAGKLFKCLRQVLQMGLKYHGASDDSFRLIDGSKGAMQDHFSVYRKQKTDCPNSCGTKIQRITLGGRGTFFCPRCQI